MKKKTEFTLSRLMYSCAIFRSTAIISVLDAFFFISDENKEESGNGHL